MRNMLPDTATIGRSIVTTATGGTITMPRGSFLETALGILFVIAFVALVIAGFILFLDPAWAHMKERPGLDHWFMTLYSKERGPCCDSTDAETMADPDWRNASEMKKGECVQSAGEQGDLTPVFCVRLENPAIPGDWKWWTVPKAANVEMSPNRAGPALIWWFPIDAGPDFKPYIRCFLPGGGA